MSDLVETVQCEAQDFKVILALRIWIDGRNDGPDSRKGYWELSVGGYFDRVDATRIRRRTYGRRVLTRGC